MKAYSREQNELRTKLRSVGLRATPARMMILALLKESAEPMRAQLIWRALGSDAPDLATVYRVIGSLVTTGLVQEVMLTADAISYEIAGLPHHHHLTCAKCGLVEDIQDCSIVLQPESNSFARVTGHRLEFEGVCKKCTV